MKFLLHDKRAWNMECKMIMSYLVSNKICIHTHTTCIACFVKAVVLLYRYNIIAIVPWRWVG